MSNLAKFGLFSDGGYRMRVVAPGYDADPAPADQRNIIFDSDWAEALASAPGYFGSTSIATSGSTAVSFATALPYAPFGFYAMPPAAALSYIGTSIVTPYMASLLASAYVGWPSFQQGGAFSAANLVTSPSGMTFQSAASGGTALWMALVNDPGVVAGSAPSRVGVGTWMSLTKDGPVVARPGQTIYATDPKDFLIPPLSSDYVLNQPIIAGTVDSLPWLANSTITYAGGSETVGNYGVTIPHGLGYVPIFFGTYTYDFRSIPTVGGSAYLAADTSNFYVVFPGGPAGSSGSMLSLAPTSYFVLSRRWI